MSDGPIATMTPRRAREVLTEPAATSDRSMYVACEVCGALLVKRDAGRHGRFHEALAVLAARVFGPEAAP